MRVKDFFEDPAVNYLIYAEFSTQDIIQIFALLGKDWTAVKIKNLMVQVKYVQLLNYIDSLGEDTQEYTVCFNQEYALKYSDDNKYTIYHALAAVGIIDTDSPVVLKTKKGWTPWHELIINGHYDPEIHHHIPWNTRLENGKKTIAHYVAEHTTHPVPEKYFSLKDDKQITVGEIYHSKR